MAIRPSKIATRRDKHKDAHVQFERVQGKIDSLLVDYNAIGKLLHGCYITEEASVWNVRILFSGDVEVGLLDLLTKAYIDHGWLNVSISGWSVENFEKSPHRPALDPIWIQDIGGSKDHLFEVKLSCMSVLMS